MKIKQEYIFRATSVCVCLYVCLCVNQDVANHSCYKQGLVIVYGDMDIFSEHHPRHSYGQSAPKHFPLPIQFKATGNSREFLCAAFAGILGNFCNFTKNSGNLWKYCFV